LNLRNNRGAINAEFTQLVAEMDRIAASTAYNNTSILRGFGNVVSENFAVSTALVSTATGVTNVTLSGAPAGAYVFSDADSTDNRITLGNGVLSQTINLGPALDNDAAGGVVATGSTVVANFDRLGIVLNLSGQKDGGGSNPTIAGYRDGSLDGESLLITGGTGGTLQVGANAVAVDRIEVNIEDMSATGAKMNLSGVSLSTLQSSRSAITTIDLAIETVSRVRGDLGAQQNRLNYTINNIGVSVENLQSSESIVRDADVAEEVSNFTRNQILVQSSTALLAQANAVPQNALTLLQ
jgi:flagellin